MQPIVWVSGIVQTALYLGAQVSDDVALARCLLDARADVNLATDQGGTPLMIALLCGNARVAKLLIDAGSNLDQPNQGGLTALHIAVHSAARGRCEDSLVLKIVSAGASLTATTIEGFTPRQLALNFGKVSLYDALAPA